MRVGIILFLVSFSLVASNDLFGHRTTSISGAELKELMKSLSPITIGDCSISEIIYSSSEIRFIFERGGRSKAYKMELQDDSISQVTHSGNKASIYYYAPNGVDSFVLEVDSGHAVHHFIHYHETSKLEKIIGILFNKSAFYSNECKLESERVSDGSRQAPAAQVSSSDSETNVNSN